MLRHRNNLYFFNLEVSVFLLVVSILTNTIRSQKKNFKRAVRIKFFKSRILRRILEMIFSLMAYTKYFSLCFAPEILSLSHLCLLKIFARNFDFKLLILAVAVNT